MRQKTPRGRPSSLLSGAELRAMNAARRTMARLVTDMDTILLARSAAAAAQVLRHLDGHLAQALAQLVHLQQMRASKRSDD